MSENNKIQNEEELWDLLSAPVTTEPKADKPKLPKIESKEAPAPKAEPVGQSVPEVQAEPAAAAEPAPKAEAPKSAKKLDGFFVACMAGVAAVSVAATLLVSSILGGNSSSGVVKGSASGDLGGSSVSAELEQEISDLKLENAELRAQLEQQKQQVKDLQSDLLTLMGSEDFLANASTDPTGDNEELTAQMKALETFAAIQEAYADFDRERLEELIPQMDEQLSYLTPEMLNNYYLILEYVEQPSNG